MLILIKQWGRPLPSLSKGRGTAAAVDEYAFLNFQTVRQIAVYPLRFNKEKRYEKQGSGYFGFKGCYA